MRRRVETEGVSVHAIAGTYVVLLGLDIAAEQLPGLLGFTISRESATSKKRKTLGGGMFFDRLQSEAEHPMSDAAPVQAFLWGDYDAQPGETYTYRVVPQYGKPGALQPGPEVQVTVTTEKRDDGVHSIYFNRGVAGSQAYARHFGEHRRWYLLDINGRVTPTELIKPENVPDDEAAKWLSRGLEEALLAFIAQATGPEYSLRASVYEFTHIPVIQAFVDALERDVDVQIIHHAKRENVVQLKTQRNPNDGTDNWGVVTTTTWDSGTSAAKTYKNKFLEVAPVKDAVCRAAEVAVAQVGLKRADCLKAFRKLLIERTETTISHNKFIILLKNGKPIQVWTGSTNMTGGGIFGQSNVGHVIRDAKVARKYLAYWKMLAKDPAKADIRSWTAKQTPDLTKVPANSITPIFSPRTSKAMLDWYANQTSTAKQAVFFTAAFSVDKRFLTQFSQATLNSSGDPCQRYILLESNRGPMKDKFDVLTALPQNQIAWGALLAPPRGSTPDVISEVLTGLNDHVSYVHTKYLIVDPLSDDPLVVTGSANFSENSTTENDENMLVIRGDTRVADIFLGEFMRLFQHFRNRNLRNNLSPAAFKRSRHLAIDDRWTSDYFTPATPQCQERLLFR